MKKLLFLALFSASLSAAQVKQPGRLLSLKPKHQGLAAAIDIEEEKTKASIRSLPKELQELVLLQTYLEKIEAGTLFDSSNQSATKKAAYQLERALRGVYKTHAASARMLIKALIDNNQLILFLENVDVNKLPQEMIEIIIDEAQDKKFDIQPTDDSPINIFELLSRYTDNKHFAWLQQHKKFPAAFNPRQLITHNDKFDQVDLIYDAVGQRSITHNIKNPSLLKNYIKADFSRTQKPVDPKMLMDATAYNPNPEIIKALVELGFNPNAVSCIGKPLIHKALYNENALGIIQELINQGADVNATTGGLLQEIIGGAPISLFQQLVIAAANNDFTSLREAKEIATLLLKHGASTEGVRKAIIKRFKTDPAAKKEFLDLIAPYEPQSKKPFWQFWK